MDDGLATSASAGGAVNDGASRQPASPRELPFSPYREFSRAEWARLREDTPMTLVRDYADPGGVDAPVAAATAFGFRFADKKSATKMTIYGVVGLLLGVICLAVGVGGIVRSVGLAKQMARTEAELTSQRKARRETQTGLQQQ